MRREVLYYIQSCTADYEIRKTTVTL
eukprot:COSAG06_NODE_40972_length_396_cov_1.097643_1_plen_25_part_10